jgi:TRAP-type uncharacterized transport system fused permease subunit
VTHATTTIAIAVGVALIGLFLPHFTRWTRVAFLVLAAGIALDNTVVGMVGLVLVLIATIHDLVLARRRSRTVTGDQGKAVPHEE